MRPPDFNPCRIKRMMDRNAGELRDSRRDAERRRRQKNTMVGSLEDEPQGWGTGNHCSSSSRKESSSQSRLGLYPIWISSSSAAVESSRMRKRRRREETSIMAWFFSILTTMCTNLKAKRYFWAFGFRRFECSLNHADWDGNPTMLTGKPPRHIINNPANARTIKPQLGPHAHLQIRNTQ